MWHICYILQNPTDVLSDNYIEFSFNDKLLLSFSILKIVATKFKNNEPVSGLEELIITWAYQKETFWNNISFAALI